MFQGDIAYALRVDEIDEEAQIVKGQFATINREYIPQYEQNGVVDSVNLPIDAGLYYPSHFVYFVKNRHFVAEFNRNGPSITKLQEYLENKLADSPEPILTSAFFRQIIKEDVVQAIESMGSIAEVAIAVHKDAVDTFKGSGFQDTLNLASELAPENSIIKLGLSRATGAHQGRVVEKQVFLSWLKPRLGLASVRNSGAKVRARVEDQPDDSGASVWLDVFSAKYATKIRVKVKSNKSVDSENCYEQILEAYKRMGLLTPIP
jgi:hypothetical protein